MSRQSREKLKSQRKQKSLSGFLEEKNPILIFLLVFGVLMIAFYSLWVTDFFKQHIFDPALHINAKIASFILNIFGYATSASGMDIYNSSFSVSVKRGCDAIEPVAFFTSAVLAFPAPFGRKLPGIALGVLFLLAVNIVRIISLFLTGIYAPSAFELMHLEVWQVVFIMLAMVAWLVWIKWAQQAKQVASEKNAP